MLTKIFTSPLIQFKITVSIPARKGHRVNPPSCHSGRRHQYGRVRRPRPGCGAATSSAVTHPTPPHTRWAVNHSSARTVRSYWNPRRLAEAKPAPLPARPGTAKISSSGDGEPRTVHASRPTGTAGGLQPAASEWVTVGRLFFHNPENGGDYVCTANVVTSNNHDVIATARHCVMDISTGAWYTNFQFAPSYNKGSAPYGWWTWRSAGCSYRRHQSRWRQRLHRPEQWR